MARLDTRRQAGGLALALASLGLGCGDAADAKAPPNVILICLDTVRADHLGCYGYTLRETTPFLDGLAARSMLFEDASSTAGWTKPSVPSILTGMLPMQHGVYRGSARSELGAVSDVLSEPAVTLAEVFQERGYQTAAFVRNAQLRAGLGFEQGFETYRDQAGDAREIRWRASDWIEEREAERPFFLYLHFLDAHWPYPIPEEYASRFTTSATVEFLRSGDWRGLRDAVNDGEKQLSSEQLEGLIAVYDGALRYLDDELAKLWRQLERDGLQENTILCVVADHGEEFLEHGRIGHGHGLYQNLLQVPWILYRPGHAGERLSSPVSLVDVFPTLLAAAGIHPQRGPGGIDRIADPQQETIVMAEHLDSKRYQLSWRQGDFKRIDVLEPQRSAGESRLGPGDIPLGSRLEASVRVEQDGRAFVTRLRPAQDQDPRPPEVKGVIEALGDGWLQVLGMRVRVGAQTELYGETRDASGTPRELRTGLLVKARGAILAGSMEAEKVKLYAPDAELEAQVRGVFEGAESDGLVLSGVRLRLDANSQLELGREEPDLAPADVLEILSGERTLVASDGQCYDLEGDADETRPGALPTAFREDSGRSDLWGRLLEARSWGEGSAKSLDARALAELRAIGYVE